MGGPESTYGFAKSEGDILAADYKSDVAREKAAFLESSKRVSSLQPKLDSKTWWFVRDELRTQTYNMRSSMLALNGVSPRPRSLRFRNCTRSSGLRLSRLTLPSRRRSLPLPTRSTATSRLPSRPIPRPSAHKQALF